MADGTNAIEFILSRVIGQRGYVEKLAQVGAREIDTGYDDLTDSQANLIDVCAKDEEMQAKLGEVFDLADDLEEKFGLDKARPWLNGKQQ